MVGMRRERVSDPSFIPIPVHSQVYCGYLHVLSRFSFPIFRYSAGRRIAEPAAPDVPLVQRWVASDVLTPRTRHMYDLVALGTGVGHSEPTELQL